MKKNLLVVASIFFGATSFAQFTSANAPVIGETQVLYIVDSLAPSLSAVTGAGAVWDYSNVLGYQGITRTIEVLDPILTGTAMDFGTSTAAQDLESFLMSFSINSATERTSQGFVFTEPNYGAILAKYDTPVVTHSYPMDFGSAAITTAYTGNVYYTDTSTMSGNIVISIDGKGTLKLGNVDYPNVLRYKTVDVTDIQGPVPMMKLNRTQYEYYDLANGHLPIFVHVNVELTVLMQPLFNRTIVLSKEQPSQFVSVSKNELENTSVYPNPTDNQLNIELPSSIESADVVITDALGRHIYVGTLNSEVKSIDVSNLNKGMYFVKISNDVYSTTKNIVVK